MFNKAARFTKLVGIAGILLSSASPLAQAQDAFPCPAYEPPVIHVTPHLDEPSLDTSRSLAQIKAFSGLGDTMASGQHEVPVGVTMANLVMATNFELSLRPEKTTGGIPYYCAAPTRFELDLAINETTIYIAHEVPEGSCSYLTVLQHEGFHVATDRDLVVELTTSLSPFLAREMRAISPVAAPTQDAAKDILNSRIKDYMKDLKEIVVKTRETRQKAVDAPEEYERITKSCDGALRAIISKARQHTANNE